MIFRRNGIVLQASTLILACIAFSACEDSDSEASQTDEEATAVSEVRFSDSEYPCCFDFDGDEEPDSTISALLDNLSRVGGGGGPITDFINMALADGSTNLLVDFDGMPEDLSQSSTVTIRGTTGTNDLDGDGEPDQDATARLNGDGVYEGEVENPAFAFESADATLSDGVVELDSDISWRIPLPLRGNEALYIPVNQLQISAELQRNADGQLSSIQTATTVEEQTIELGGMRVGGLVPVEDLVTSLNGALSSCECAGLTAGDDLLLYNGVVNDSLEVICDAELEVDSSSCTRETSGQLCPLISLLCNASSLIPNLADTDTNDDDINDAYTVGLYMTLVPASIEE
jgi:hypothetical protein